MKVKITYTPGHERAAQATLDALRTMYPAARIKQRQNGDVSIIYLTVKE